MTKARTGMGMGARLGLVAVAVTLLGNVPAMGTNLFWSGNGTSQGGVGTWNTTTAHFDPVVTGTPTGTYGVTWVNANVDSAEFGGTAGQVNLAGPLTVNLITTDITGFNIGNANSAATANRIDFSGANSGVTTGAAGTTTTLSAFFTGTLTKSGGGRLEMGNGTGIPNTVKYVITAGDITTASIARLSATAPGALVQDFLTFNGGGWAINTGNQDTGANRGITVKSGGAFFGSSTIAGAGNITVSSPIVGTEGGGITVTGAGPFTGNSSSTAGAVLILSNTANSWDGGATINGPSGSKIVLGAAGVIPDTAVVSILASGNIFDLNGFDETVKAIAGTAGTVAVGTKTLTIADGAGQSFTSVFTASAGGKIVKNGSGTWTLSGSSTGFNGEFVMNTGTLGVGGSNIFGNGTDNTDASAFTYNGGVLSNTGTGGRTVPAGVTVALNANLTADDSLFNSSQPGQVLFNGPATMNSDRTFTINGTANFGFADLRESGGSRNVIKNGAGTLALTGAVPADPNAFTGSVTVNAGRLQVSTTSFIGNESNALILSGGALNSSGNRDVSAAMIKNPITLTADSAVTTTSSAATVNLNLNTSSFTLTGGTTLTFRNDGANDATDLFAPRFSGSGFNFTSNINIDNGAIGKTQLASFNQSSTQTFSGVVSGTGGYRRGSGTAGLGGVTVFSGANSYQGDTVINDGTVQADNTSGSATGTSIVYVGDGAPATTEIGRLSGTGSVSGTVNAREGGYIAPGDVGGSPGTLTATGNVNMLLNSHLSIELSGASADKLAVGGNLDLSAAEFLDVTGVGSGSSWVIGSYVGTLSGIFDSITSGYTVDYGTGTNSVITLNVAAACAPGDLNCDGHVDAGDYVFWRKNGGTPDDANYTAWRSNFGVPPGAGSGGGLNGGTVPEPSAIVLLVMGLLAVAVRRRG